MPAVAMVHDADPRSVLMEKVGDIGDVEVFNNQVLVAVYIRPEKTAGGIYLTDKNRDEDKHQGKVGLVIKKGPQACVSDDKWTFPEINEGDWIFFRASDGWAVTLNKGLSTDGVLCRVLDDVNIRGRVQHPDQVW
jgi:co-chaperonin GroES (HSP10)